MWNDKGEIALFDMFNKGHWIGSRNLLRHCEHQVRQSQHEDDWIYNFEELKENGFTLVKREQLKQRWFEDNGVKILENNIIRAKK